MTIIIEKAIVLSAPAVIHKKRETYLEKCEFSIKMNALRSNINNKTR